MSNHKSEQKTYSTRFRDACFANPNRSPGKIGLGFICYKYTNRDGEFVSLSNTQIASELGCCERTARRLKQGLINDQLIEVVKPGVNGHTKSILKLCVPDHATPDNFTGVNPTGVSMTGAPRTNVTGHPGKSDHLSLEDSESLCRVANPKHRKKVKSANKSNGSNKELPEDWRPDEKTRAWAMNGNIGATPKQLEAEIVRFRNHYRAKGETFKRPDLTFRNWMERGKTNDWIETSTSKPKGAQP